MKRSALHRMRDLLESSPDNSPSPHKCLPALFMPAKYPRESVRGSLRYIALSICPTCRYTSPGWSRWQTRGRDDDFVIIYCSFFPSRILLFFTEWELCRWVLWDGTRLETGSQYFSMCVCLRPQQVTSVCRCLSARTRLCWLTGTAGANRRPNVLCSSQAKEDRRSRYTFYQGRISLYSSVFDRLWKMFQSPKSDGISWLFQVWISAVGKHDRQWQTLLLMHLFWTISGTLVLQEHKLCYGYIFLNVFIYFDDKQCTVIAVNSQKCSKTF